MGAYRRVLAWMCAALAISLAIGAAAIWLYGYPPTDSPSRADAVVVIGPPTVARLKVAQAMVDDGTVPLMIVSVPADWPLLAQRTPGGRLGRLCSGQSPDPVQCFTPEPFTTQGEARHIRDLITENGWSRVIVVTSAPHVVRARVLFDRCSPDADVAFVTDGRRYTPLSALGEAAYQTAAFVKVLLTAAC